MRPDVDAENMKSSKLLVCHTDSIQVLMIIPRTEKVSFVKIIPQKAQFINEHFRKYVGE